MQYSPGSLEAVAVKTSTSSLPPSMLPGTVKIGRFASVASTVVAPVTSAPFSVTLSSEA